MDAKTLADWAKKYPTTALGDDGMTVVTGVCRLAFVHFDKPHSPKGTNKEPRYQCAIILDPAANIDALKAACAKAWSESPLKNQKPKMIPFKPQAPMLAEGYEGFGTDGIFFNAETKSPVDLFGPDLKPLDVSQAYSGMWARVKVRASAYDVAGNNGVKFWLQGVQKFADDTKFSGGSSEDGFEAVGGSAPNGTGVAATPNGAAGSFF